MSRILSDDVKREQYREKERLRYKKRKEEGTLKPISERSRRDQKKQRQLWKANSNHHYLKKKGKVDPPMLDTDTPTRQKQTRRKIAVANKAKLYRLTNRLRIELKKSTALLDKYKKRFNRTRQSVRGSPSPRKVVKNIIRSGKNAVSQQLLFGEVLKKQLKYNYAACSSINEKKQHTKVLAGNFLKKYKITYMANCFLSLHLYRRFMKRRAAISDRKIRSDCLASESGCVRMFLEDDIHTIRYEKV